MRSHLSAPNASSPGTDGAGGAFDVSPVAVQRDESGEVVPSEVIYVFSFRILVEFILLQASAPTTHIEFVCACVRVPARAP